MVNKTIELDCKNLNCPMPIIEVSKTMRKLKPGEMIKIEATDPAFKPDIEAWVKKMGHEILSFEDGRISKAVILKRG